ncbi:MAG: hypothetical protein Q7T20_09515 [Saprospiraceae bacterium]|nr:hypothetical protein [Saprospiraceae bacterium]
MSQILLNLAVSLDGLIEGPNGEFDWCFTDQDYGMTAFLARCDAIIFGRKSYELLKKNPLICIRLAESVVFAPAYKPWT